MSDPNDRAPTLSIAKLFLIVLPIGLFLSICVALWWGSRNHGEVERADSEFTERSVTENDVSDLLHKLHDLLGERNGMSEPAAASLTGASSMTEGLLGPSNTGYTIQRVAGPAEWPLLVARVPDCKDTSGPVWVISSLDTRPGSPGTEANTTGLAATVAAARSLVRHARDHDVRFVFVPHANDRDAPIAETISILATQIQNAPPAKAILCVEAMGCDTPLWISSRDTRALPLARAEGIGEVRGAETICLGEDTDLASMLYELGLPATRVATRPLVLASEADDAAPSARAVSASSSKLVALIKRCEKTR